VDQPQKTPVPQQTQIAGAVASTGNLERFNNSCGQDGKSVGRFREVLDCGSPLPLWRASAAVKKRQGAAAVQDAGARFDCRSLFGGYGIFENALSRPKASPHISHGFAASSSFTFFITANASAT
jgi:hypothetical protein